MRRRLFFAALVLGLLLLAGLGAAISLVRSALSLSFERSITA
jgi:hypothetical protein